MSAARPVVAFLLLAALAGCGSSGGISAKDLSHLVLQQQDLGSSFASFNSGPQTQLDNQGTPRANPQRDGREGGWIARFHRPGSFATKGPLVVESRVDVFKTDGGAKSDLNLYGQTFQTATRAGGKSLAAPQVGDQALAMTFVQPGAQPLRFYRIAWRYRNATASVTAEGFDRKLALGQALALARKQQHLLAQG